MPAQETFEQQGAEHRIDVAPSARLRATTSMLCALVALKSF